MTPSPDHTMKENLAWVQWWAFPWRSSHEGWRSLYPEINLTHRTGVLATSELAGITPCLPPAPNHAVRVLALASAEQLDLALALIHGAVNPATARSLSEGHRLWCMSLFKAFPPDMLLPNDDPLHLLRSWVEPPAWQRLRLRFPSMRVLDIEKSTPVTEVVRSRLTTLWQAVAWRVTSMESHDTLPDPYGQGI